MELCASHQALLTWTMEHFSLSFTRSPHSEDVLQPLHQSVDPMHCQLVIIIALSHVVYLCSQARSTRRASLVRALRGL